MRKFALAVLMAGAMGLCSCGGDEKPPTVTVVWTHELTRDMDTGLADEVEGKQLVMLVQTLPDKTGLISASAKVTVTDSQTEALLAEWTGELVWDWNGTRLLADDKLASEDARGPKSTVKQKLESKNVDKHNVATELELEFVDIAGDSEETLKVPLRAVVTLLPIVVRKERREAPLSTVRPE